MTKTKNRSTASLIAITIALSLSDGFFSNATAQIVRDGTAGGAAGALTGPNFTIDAVDGLASGANLFHSFSDFQIATGETATFTDTTGGGFARVISRVTGANLTTIDGALTVDGATLSGADFFFINPNGVTISENASINVPASFYLSTADQLNFENGDALIAGGLAGSVFSAATPASFGFLGAGAGAIVIDDTSITASAGNNLGIVGGNSVTITDSVAGGSTTTLQSIDGVVGVVAVNSAQFVPLNFDVSGLDVSSLGDVNISSAGEQPQINNMRNTNGAVSKIVIAGKAISLDNVAINSGTYTSDQTGADIEILTENYSQSGGGFITADNFGSGTGGSVSLFVSENFVLGDGGSAVVSGTINAIGRPGSTGDVGDINIDVAGNFVMQGAAQVINVTDSDGQGGDGTISVGGDFSVLDDNTVINVETLGSGSGGALDIDVNGAVLMSGANRIGASSSGNGDAGSITVDADRFVSNNGEIITRTSNGGRGGDVILNIARDIQFAGGGFGVLGIVTASDGLGDAGNILINADSIEFSALTVQTSVDVLGGAKAGSVELIANRIELNNSAGILSGTSNAGDAGNIIVTAQDLILDEGALTTGTISGGNAGDITVNVVRLQILNGGIIIANTSGDGNSGDLIINAGESIVMSGIGFPARAGGNPIYSEISTLSNSAGNAGTIAIMTPSLSMTEQATITASTEQAGLGGSITIDADSLNLSDRSRLLATTTGTGKGGNINIRAGNFDILNSSVETSATVSGGSIINAGSINIDADNLTLTALPDESGLQFFATISSNANGRANGGPININVNGDLTLDGSPRYTFIDILGTGQNLIPVRLGDASITSNYFGSDGMGETRAGDVNISASNIYMSDVSLIGANSLGFGNGGSVTLDVVNDIIFTSAVSLPPGTQAQVGPTVGAFVLDPNLTLGGIVPASIPSGADIKAGNVTITAGNLISLTQADFAAGTQALDIDSGSLVVTAPFIELDNAFFTAETQRSGNAGSVLVNAQTILLTNGSAISSGAGVFNLVFPNLTATERALQFGNFEGDAGTVTINTTDLTIIGGANQSAIRTTSVSGNGGDININFTGSQLIMRDDALIETAVLTGGGRAGDINIATPSVIILDDADIRTSADTGGGGAINIDASVIIPIFGFLEVVENRTRAFADPISFLDPSSSSGVSGNIALGGFEGDVTAGVEELEESFLDASDVLDRRCAGVRTAGAPSTLTQEGAVVRGKRPNDIAPAFYGENEKFRSDQSAQATTAKSRLLECSYKTVLN